MEMKYLMAAGLLVVMVVSGVLLYLAQMQKDYDPYYDVGKDWNYGLNLSMDDCSKAYTCRYAYNYDMPAPDSDCSNQTYVMDLVDACLGSGY